MSPNGNALTRAKWPLLLALIALPFMHSARGASPPPRYQEFTFNIPPQKAPVKIGNQSLTLIASGIVTLGEANRNDYFLKLELTANLSDFQQHLTEILRAQLNKDDPCGDHIAIEDATLTPADPSAEAAVRLHYERYACMKVFGKRKSRRLIAGNGLIRMKFTPAIGEGETLRLVPEVESIQADGSLGELLGAGPIGESVRRKVKNALLAALEKGTDRSLTLPPAVQNVAKIDKARFADDGAGSLAVVLAGEVNISREQIQMIKEKLQQTLHSH